MDEFRVRSSFEPPPVTTPPPPRSTGANQYVKKINPNPRQSSLQEALGRLLLDLKTRCMQAVCSRNRPLIDNVAGSDFCVRAFEDRNR